MLTKYDRAGEYININIHIIWEDLPLKFNFHFSLHDGIVNIYGHFMLLCSFLVYLNLQSFVAYCVSSIFNMSLDGDFTISLFGITVMIQLCSNNCNVTVGC